MNVYVVSFDESENADDRLQIHTREVRVEEASDVLTKGIL